MKNLYLSSLLLAGLILIMFHPCQAQSSQKSVTVYTDNFSGNSSQLSIGKYDFVYLAQSGISMVHSIRIPAGMKVTLFEKDHFEGKSIELTEDANEAFLKSRGFAQMAQLISLIVAEAPTPQPTNGLAVTIYKDNFAGAAKNLSVGFYDFFDLGNVDNDQLSSVKIPKGLKVTLYEHKESGGRKLVLTKDTDAKFLIANKFNDVTSSILVEVEPIPVPTPSPVITPTPTPTPAPPVVEPVYPEDMVTIFQGDLNDAYKSFSAGRYGMDELGIANDELSSIKIPYGFKVTLFEHAAFEGRSLVLTQTTRATTFVDNNFNNVTSSLLVERLPVVTIYEGDYTGASKSFPPGSYSLAELGIRDNELSSIRVSPDLRVKLFELDGKAGRSLTLTHDAGTEFLTKNNFNNLTSSIEVESTEAPQLMVTLYDYDFSGPSKKLAPGKYDHQDLGIGNNAISSISIPRGLRVTLFEHGAFEGRSMVIRKDASTRLFDRYQFNDITSSVIVEELPMTDLVVTIYSDKFSGKSQQLAPGRYRASDLQIGTKQLSSLRVPPGMRAELFEDPNFNGLGLTIEEDRDFTGSKIFDNLYTAIMVEDIFVPIVTPVAQQEVVVIEKPVEVPVETSPTVVYDYSPPCEFTSQEYATALKAVESKPFSDEKMAMAKLVTKDKCMTNDQIRLIATQFMFEEQTLEFMKYAYTLASEKSTYYTLESVFKFNSSKQEFLKFLSSPPPATTPQTTTTETQTTTATVTVKPTSTTSLKREAEEFCLKVVDTYVREDCQSYLNLISNQIYSYEDGGIITLDENMKSKICESSIKNAIKDNSKTLQDYVNTYKIQILTKEELEKKFGIKLPDYYKMNEEDFFFVGAELKEGFTKENGFVWSDMYNFLVSKSEGTWKVKGM